VQYGRPTAEKMGRRFVVVTNIGANAKESVRAFVADSLSAMPSINTTWWRLLWNNASFNTIEYVANVTSYVHASGDQILNGSAWTTELGVDLKQTVAAAVLHSSDNATTLSDEELTRALNFTFTPSHFAQTCAVACVIVVVFRECYIRRTIKSVVALYGFHE